MKFAYSASVSALTLLIPFSAVVQGQNQDQGVSQDACASWTQGHIFDPNPEMKFAEETYIGAVKNEIEEVCFEPSNGEPTTCHFTLPENSQEGDAYKRECQRWGGRIWTYTYHPLCGSITSTDQTGIKNVMVCASASCDDSGVVNLIPQRELRTLKGEGCASGFGDLKMMKLDNPEPNTQPECYEWTQAHLFDTNPAMKPAEDAYLQMAAGELQDNCIDPETNTIKECDVELSSSDFISLAYYDECKISGGEMYSYSVQPLCGSGSDSPSMSLEPVLVCASASCAGVGVRNLYPQQVALYQHFKAIDVACGSSIDPKGHHTEFTPDGRSSAGQVTGSLLAAGLCTLATMYLAKM